MVTLWRYASLCVHALVAAGSEANAQNRRVNSSLAATSSSTTSQSSPASDSLPVSSPILITLSDYEEGSLSTRRPNSIFLPSYNPDQSVASPSPTTSQSEVSHLPPQVLFPNSTSTISISSTSTNSSTTQPGPCTGCVIQAYNPVTTSFNKHDYYNPWNSTVVTETILTEFVTYLHNGSAIDTVVTEERTVNQTKTVIGPENETITHQTPTFMIEATPGVYVTVDAGPTYVLFNNLNGGIDEYIDTTYPFLELTLQTCDPYMTTLKDWQPAETATEDWSYFIATYTDGVPSPVTHLPVALPAKLIEYLKQDPDIQSQFHGSDIATCTLRQTHGMDGPEIPSVPSTTAMILPLPSVTTGTFLSTTYESTSTHITHQGCLRLGCGNTKPDDIAVKTPDSRISELGNDPTPAPSHKPDESQQSDKKPQPDGPSKTAANTDRPTPDGPKSVPNLPIGIGSIINNNPTIWTHQTPVTTADNSITIGASVFPINTPKQTQTRDGQNQVSSPVIVVGSETFTPGQTKTINGVPVVVLTNDGGTRLVVDGSTITYNPAAPTGPPVLTIGSNTFAPNREGDFVVGTETLRPGGPAITVDGSTLSLAPSGAIAVVNGVTQTLANGPAPTAAPALTLGGQTISATMIGGSTVFVVVPGQTLTPGSALTVDGTTFSMPANGYGSTIVVNGQTSILGAGQSALTLGSHSITANVIGGTTAYAFGPGQTLKPGGVLIISGTTFSMPASASGSVVVINGVTSTLAHGPGVTLAPALTVNGKIYPYTVRDGTTEYVLGDGTTLAPGLAVIISGTTYSLDEQGTALVVNGQTSSIPNVPASNSASTTRSGSGSTDAKGSSTTSLRGAGDLIASGIGESSKGAGASAHGGAGFQKWVENAVIGVAGWLVLLL